MQARESGDKRMKGKKRLAPVCLNGQIYDSADIKLPKNYRCKSRKLYIKLLMGGDIGRDWAKALAELDLVWHGSYKRVWKARCINRENPGVHVF